MTDNDSSPTTEDNVIVPPEVADGLEALQQSGELNPDRREETRQRASEQDLDATVKWMEKVGDEVYERAARGRFVAGDEA